MGAEQSSLKFEDSTSRKQECQKNVFRLHLIKKCLWNSDVNAQCNLGLFNPSTNWALVFDDEYDHESKDLVSFKIDSTLDNGGIVIDDYESEVVFAPVNLVHGDIAEICFLVEVRNFDAKKICNKILNLDTNKLRGLVVNKKTLELTCGRGSDIFRGNFSMSHCEPMAGQEVNLQIINYTMHDKEGLHMMSGIFSENTRIEFLSKNPSIVLTGDHVHNLSITQRDAFTTHEEFMKIKDNIIGCDNIIDDIWTLFINPRLKNLSDPPLGAIFSGPPGQGKSALAYQISKVTRSRFIFVKAGDLKRPTVGSSEKVITQLFKQAKNEHDKYGNLAMIYLIFFDEFDAIASKRVNSEVSSHENDIVNQLLAIIGGIEPLSPNIIIFATTNRVDSLDPAMIRSGRLDTIFDFKYPDVDARTKLINHYFSKIIVKDFKLKPIQTDKLLPITANMSGADVENIFKKTALVLSQMNTKTIDIDVTDIVYNEIVKIKKISNDPFFCWNEYLETRFKELCWAANNFPTWTPALKWFVCGDHLSGKKAFFKAVANWCSFKFIPIVFTGHLNYDLEIVRVFKFDDANNLFYLPNCLPDVSKYFCEIVLNSDRQIKNKSIIVMVQKSSEENLDMEFEFVNLQDEDLVNKILNHYGKIDLKQTLLDHFQDQKSIAFGEMKSFMMQHSNPCPNDFLKKNTSENEANKNQKRGRKGSKI